MTSKNCFSKMLVRDLKERGVWLISSIILFLLIYPVQILMSLDAIASYMKGEEEFQSRITEQFSSLISFGNDHVCCNRNHGVFTGNVRILVRIFGSKNRFLSQSSDKKRKIVFRTLCYWNFDFYSSVFH